MKHLFCVHSHISFFVSKQYILDKGINPNDCLFLCTRNYKLPTDFISTFNNILAYPSEVLEAGQRRLLQNGNPIVGFKNLKFLEKAICNYFGEEDFVYYVPNTYALDCSSAIVTMSHCLFFYIIEEGAASYDSVSKSTSIFCGWKRLVFWLLRIVLKRFYVLRGSFYSVDHPKYKGTVASSARAFTFLPGDKFITENPFCQENLDNIPDAILSVDASLRVLLSTKDANNLFQQLRSIFLEHNYSQVAYKFHPDYYANPEDLCVYREIIVKTFGDIAYELSPEAVLENILNTYTIDFYSDCSSVALYRLHWKGKCYSYNSLIAPICPDWAEKVKNSFIIQFYSMI